MPRNRIGEPVTVRLPDATLDGEAKASGVSLAAQARAVIVLAHKAADPAQEVETAHGAAPVPRGEGVKGPSPLAVSATHPSNPNPHLIGPVRALSDCPAPQPKVTSYGRCPACGRPRR